MCCLSFLRSEKGAKRLLKRGIGADARSQPMLAPVGWACARARCRWTAQVSWLCASNMKPRRNQSDCKDNQHVKIYNIIYIYLLLITLCWNWNTFTYLRRHEGFSCRLAATKALSERFADKSRLRCFVEDIKDRKWFQMISNDLSLFRVRKVTFLGPDDNREVHSFTLRNFTLQAAVSSFHILVSFSGQVGDEYPEGTCSHQVN